MSFMRFTAIPRYESGGKKMIPRNCLWLDTIYWGFVWGFKEEAINWGFESLRFTIDQLDCEFYFRISKTETTKFSVELHRVLKDRNVRPDDGFVLHLILSVVGLGRQPEDLYLYSSKDNVMASYDITNLDFGETLCSIVKCGFEMCEFTTLNNEAFRKQDELIKKIIKRKKNKVQNLAIVSRMLDRLELDCVFSGRQTDEFATTKAGLIERSVEFAGDIMIGFLDRASTNSNIPFSRNTELGLILGYIYGKNSRCIEDWEVLRLYATAFRYGLLALKGDCIDYMKNKLEDTHFLLSVLVFCDVQCDNSLLMSTAFKKFLYRIFEICRSPIWKNFVDARWYAMRSIIDTLSRKVDKKAEGLLLQEEVPTSISEHDAVMMKMSIYQSFVAIQSIVQKLKRKK